MQLCKELLIEAASPFLPGPEIPELLQQPPPRSLEHGKQLWDPSAFVHPKLQRCGLGTRNIPQLIPSLLQRQEEEQEGKKPNPNQHPEVPVQ